MRVLIDYHGYVTDEAGAGYRRVPSVTPYAGCRIREVSAGDTVMVMDADGELRLGAVASVDAASGEVRLVGEPHARPPEQLSKVVPITHCTAAR